MDRKVRGMDGLTVEDIELLLVALDQLQVRGVEAARQVVALADKLRALLPSEPPTLEVV